MLVAALASTLVIGHSSEGREIRATRVGAVQAPVKVLVVGDVHGNEPAGEAIVQALRRESVDGVQFWLIRTANPDGRKARSRHNARGVDLNRNFPYRWAKGAKGTYYPGPSAGSEPETKALMRFVRRIRPQLGIYYHQHMGITVRARERRHRGPTRLRPPHRAAAALAAELPRHGDRLAEPPDLRRDGVRGRAQGRPGAGENARRRRDRGSQELCAMRIVLIRHGETEWSASGKHTSVTDIPLTQRGREKAVTLKNRLAGHEFALVLSSPRQRALETAQLAGFEPQVDHDLVEVDYGDYEGLTTPEIRETRPGWTLWADGSPGGETVADAGARVDRVIERAVAADGDVALFAHGHILRVLGARWLDLPAGARREPAAGHRRGLRARLRARDAGPRALEHLRSTPFPQEAG